MIVITGPTGSGKTNDARDHPVGPERADAEDSHHRGSRRIRNSRRQPGADQARDRADLCERLAFFVRRIPDVIMVGEIRDSETAHVAVHAALTGHLVLTTLHTETAAAALPRLLDLGVEAYLLRSILRAVIAQRLVRQLCERCKSRQVLCEADLRRSAPCDARFKAGETTHAPVGCERCGGTGYRGRLGVFEVLDLDDELRGLIGEKTDGLKIDRTANPSRMTRCSTTASPNARPVCTAHLVAVTRIRRG